MIDDVLTGINGVNFGFDCSGIGGVGFRVTQV
jgi:hypothetical protein